MRHFWSGRTIASIKRTTDYARVVDRAIRKEREATELRANREAEAAAKREVDNALVAEVAQLPLDELVQIAHECLHSANRASKHREYARHRAAIYDAKDVLLSALIRDTRAKVGTFEILQTTRHQVCECCGNDWYGDSHCYSCDGDFGVPICERRRWFLVDCGSGFRFHRPTLEADLVPLATPIEPHNPTQEARVIPVVRFGGLLVDLDAQVRIVLSAAEGLAGARRIREASSSA